MNPTSEMDSYEFGCRDAELVLELMDTYPDLVEAITDEPQRTAEQEAEFIADGWDGPGPFDIGEFVRGWMDRWDELTGEEML